MHVNLAVLLGFRPLAQQAVMLPELLERRELGPELDLRDGLFPVPEDSSPRLPLIPGSGRAPSDLAGRRVHGQVVVAEGVQSNATWPTPSACRRTRTLELAVEDILFRPPGRPSCKPLVRYKSVRYQAKSWTTPRRIVAKVEHHRGELFPRVGFIVTNMALPSRSVVRFYNKRGTAEQWIKEGKQATHWTRLSCHRFRANEVRLQLSVLAYNLGNLWRRLVLPPRIKTWSLTSLQQRLVKTGGRLVKHARYYWLLLAEGHLTRRLFGDMLRRIWALPVPAG